MKVYTLALVGLISIASSQANAQSATELSEGYYVVVGSYRPSQQALAEQMAAKLSQQGSSAQVGLDSRRNYCYVYVAKFGDLKESLAEMEKTRAAGTAADAWVRVMRSGDGAVASSAPVAKQQEQPKEAVVTKPDATVYVAIPKEGGQPIQQVIVENTPAENKETTVATTVPIIVTEAVDNPKADPVIVPQTLSNTPAFLSMFNARTNRVVEGEIEVIDTERARTITKVKGNSYLSLPDPKSTSGELTLICNAFGYRKVQHQLHYKNTESDTLQPHVDLVGNFYLVKFDLVRLHKGDISVLYNVYFYNDAAVMLPESKSELNALLAMMQDNPNYKIKLHGHTNGNASGPIITMGPSHDFFTLTNDVKKGYGSAKDLSGARAETIRDWLVTNGVAADRVETKAWGGGRMLHDKHSVHARRNVRVEVEVLQD